MIGKRNTTGEARIFEKIWQLRPHVCTNCNCNLGEQARPEYFSHIIRKSKREDLRLDPENILLECMKCHNIWDQGTIMQRVRMANLYLKLRYIKRKDEAMHDQLRAAHNEHGFVKKLSFNH